MTQLRLFGAVRTISYGFIASLFFILSSSTNASILTFDGIATSSIPDAYGDNITATSDSAGEYGMGNGFTPNITVDYFPDPDASGGVPFGVFSNGYGDLRNALGHGSFNVPGEVVLTPESGVQVILNSFDIAGWKSATYLDSQILVLNQSGTILFDSGLIDINTSSPPSHLAFSPDTSIVSGNGEPLRIVIHDVGNLGLDNVNFDQAAVPLPATVWLFGFGLFGLVFVARWNKAA